MGAIPATYRNGVVVLDATATWPVGTELVVEEKRGPIRMLTDDEHGTDPESVARWLAWYDTLPAAAAGEDEESQREWRDEMRAFNIEAVRRQMAGDSP